VANAATGGVNMGVRPRRVQPRQLCYFSRDDGPSRAVFPTTVVRSGGRSGGRGGGGGWG